MSSPFQHTMSERTRRDQFRTRNARYYIANTAQRKSEFEADMRAAYPGVEITKTSARGFDTWFAQGQPIALGQTDAEGDYTLNLYLPR